MINLNITDLLWAALDFVRGGFFYVLRNQVYCVLDCNCLLSDMNRVVKYLTLELV